MKKRAAARRTGPFSPRDQSTKAHSKQGGGHKYRMQIQTDQSVVTHNVINAEQVIINYPTSHSPEANEPMARADDLKQHDRKNLKTSGGQRNSQFDSIAARAHTAGY